MADPFDSRGDDSLTSPKKFGGNKSFADPTPTEYLEVANTVGWALANGVPVTEEDVQAMVYIQLNATPLGLDQGALAYDLKEIDAILGQRAQMSGGPLQEHSWFNKAWNEQDVTVSDETFNGIIGGVIAGPVMGSLKAMAATKLAAMGTPSVAAVTTPTQGAIRGALGSVAAKAGGVGMKTKIGLPLVAGTMGGMMIASGVGQEMVDDLGMPVGETDPALDGEAPPLQFIDTTGYYTGTPGAIVEVPADEVGATGMSTPDAVNGTGSAESYDLDPGLVNMLTGLGIDPSTLALGGNAQVSFNPNLAGDIKLPYTSFEHGIDLRGQPLTEAPSLVGPQPPPVGGFPTFDSIPDSDIRAGRQASEYLGSVSVDPNGQIMPNAFREWSNGQTLLEIAGTAAADWGVPIEVLYGLVTQESGWNPYAVGDSGNSHGLVQIFGPAHPGVTTEQANNPVFALNWAAQNLLRNYQNYGSWELAIVAHRSPAGAQHLASSNEFLSALDQNYLSNVATYAMSSTLGNTIFGGAGSALSEAGLHTTGPAAPPLVKPGRATLEVFIEAADGDVLGREVTPDEMEGKVGELEGLYKKAYRQKVRNFRGQESTDVNPQDQFTRSLKESGEGQHQKASVERSSMHQYMGNIAAILQGGI